MKTKNNWLKYNEVKMLLKHRKGKRDSRGKKMRCRRACCWVHEGWKLLVIRPELEEAELSRLTLSSHCLCCCWVRLCWTSDVWQSWLHLGSFLSLCIRDIIGTHLLATLLFAVCGRGAPCPSSQTPPDDAPWTARVLPEVLENLRSSYGAEVVLRLADHPARCAGAALEVPELPGATAGGDARTWMAPETEPLHLQVSASALLLHLSG